MTHGHRPEMNNPSVCLPCSLYPSVLLPALIMVAYTLLVTDRFVSSTATAASERQYPFPDQKCNQYYSNCTHTLRIYKNVFIYNKQRPSIVDQMQFILPDASKDLQVPSGLSIPSFMNWTEVFGFSSKLTPPTRAASIWPCWIAWKAFSKANRLEEQAVSIVKLGPGKNIHTKVKWIDIMSIILKNI